MKGSKKEMGRVFAKILRKAFRWTICFARSLHFEQMKKSVGCQFQLISRDWQERHVAV